MLDVTDTAPSHPPAPSELAANWRDDAACRGLDTELFFPGQGESIMEAKQICSSCPVRVECADYALDSGQRFGIWGGTTERDRRRERGRRRAACANDLESVA